MSRLMLINNFSGDLQVGILAADTEIRLENMTNQVPDTITLGTDHRLVLTLFNKLISNPTLDQVEIIYVDNVLAGDNNMFVQRGMEGTTAKDWPPGTRVEARLTAEVMKRAYLNRAEPYTGQGLPDPTAVDLVTKRTQGAHMASAAGAIAIGSEVRASAWNVIAIGAQTQGIGMDGIALGFKAVVSGNYSVALGPYANTDVSSDVMVGNDAHRQAGDGGGEGIAIGNYASARYVWGSITIGSYAKCSSTGGVCIGARAEVNKGDDIIRVGSWGTSKGEGSVTLGKNRTSLMPHVMKAPPRITNSPRFGAAEDIVDGFGYDFSVGAFSGGMGRLVYSSGNVVTTITEQLDIANHPDGYFIIGPSAEFGANMILRKLTFIADEVSGVTTLPTLTVGGFPKTKRWRRNQAVNPGDITFPSKFFQNGHYYTCTVGGTTTNTYTRNGPGAFPTDGATIVDNTATWQDSGFVNDISNAVQLTAITEAGDFEDIALGAGAGKVLDGICISVTTPNDGVLMGRFMAEYQLIDDMTLAGTMQYPIELLLSEYDLLWFRPNETKYFFFDMYQDFQTLDIECTARDQASLGCIFGIGFQATSTLDPADPANWPATYDLCDASALNGYASLTLAAYDEKYCIMVTETAGVGGWAHIKVRDA